MFILCFFFWIICYSSNMFIPLIIYIVWKLKHMYICSDFFKYIFQLKKIYISWKHAFKAVNKKKKYWESQDTLDIFNFTYVYLLLSIISLRNCAVTCSCDIIVLTTPFNDVNLLSKLVSSEKILSFYWYWFVNIKLKQRSPKRCTFVLGLVNSSNEQWVNRYHNTRKWILIFRTN